MSTTETTVEIPETAGAHAHCYAYGYLMSSVLSLAMTTKNRQHDPALLMEEINRVIKIATVLDASLQRHQDKRVREIRAEYEAAMAS